MPGLGHVLLRLTTEKPNWLSAVLPGARMPLWGTDPEVGSVDAIIGKEIVK